MLSRALQTLVPAAALVELSIGAAPAAAHPGHGATAALGPFHYLLEPHGDLLPVAVVIGVGALAWLWNHRPQPRPAPARKPQNDRKRR